MEILWKLEIVRKLFGNSMEIMWNGREIYRNRPPYKNELVGWLVGWLYERHMPDNLRYKNEKPYNTSLVVRASRLHDIPHVSVTKARALWPRQDRLRRRKIKKTDGNCGRKRIKQGL